MEKEKSKQYIYVVQASNESTRCKIGKTKDLERRLKDYNTMTGKSKDIIYQYLFTCEVKDMTEVEKNIKENFSILRETKNTEIYLLNEEAFEFYVQFIKSHPLFVRELFIKPDDKPEVKVKYVEKTTPSLDDRGLTRKDVMQRAQRVKDDEYYTRYEDVEKELKMYDKSIWKDKCVFCNCDDAVDNDERRTSAFALYFLQNFKQLQLKKLICTHYSSKVDLFNQGARGYVFTKDGFSEIKDDYDKLKKYPAGYDGSFDHPLSIKILNEEADIVCTNPPFSIAIDYWNLVVKSKKKFLIISSFTSVLFSAFIPFFKNNKVWAGYNRVDNFLNPDKEIAMIPAHWFTNIPITDRPKYKNLKIMSLKEIPEKHKKYDDSKTLLVDNCYIPKGYQKPFAVSAFPIVNGILEKGYKIVQEKRYTPYINGKEKFARVLVQKIEKNKKEKEDE